MNPPITAAPQQPTLPHDVRDLVELPLWGWSPTQIATMAVVVVAVVAGVVAFVLWRRRRGRPAPASAVPVDPWDDLLARLRGLSMDGPLPNLFFELSLLLREGIEKRTGITATDMTLKELQTPLHTRLPVSDADRQAIWRFLERADLIKFAEASTTPAEALEGRARVEHTIELLRPRASSVIETAMPADRVLKSHESGATR